MSTLFVLLAIFMSVYCQNDTVKSDPKGYVMFCPCMGRFGNQADQYLGALNFAKHLDRTLVLPPWVEYRPGKIKSTQVPFHTYFLVNVVQQYHRVITMEEFMAKLAPTVWPVGKRTVFCYGPRGGADSSTCAAKDGNPFGPFWDTFNVDFDNSEFFGPLYFHTEQESMRKEWQTKYTADKYPVLAFTGAPGAFPIRGRDVILQKYFKWSASIEFEAVKFIDEKIAKPFIGIHLRNGIDWERACEHVATEGGRHMFASAQCLGYTQEYGQLTKDICLPPEKDILKQIKEVANKIKAKTVFVAADNNYMISEIKKFLKGTTVTEVLKHPKMSAHIDLAILGKSDHMIGNCVSTFTGFVSRERLVNGNKPTTYFSFKPKHDEL